MDLAEIKDLLEAHHGAGYGWALSCCRRDPAEAEEVLQTVYVKVLEGKARFRGEASFKTWLFAVIRTTAADRRRAHVLRALRTLRFAELSGPGTATSDDDGPEAALSRRETSDAFREALGRLPARQREALQLVFYHDLSVEEAAAVMGVSVGSARTHYDRGKRRLRDVLEGSEVFYEQHWRARASREEVS